MTIKKCSFCKTDKTPKWRSGPEPYNVLCNACGLKYKKDKILINLNNLLNFSEILSNMSETQTDKFIENISEKLNLEDYIDFINENCSIELS